MNKELLDRILKVLDEKNEAALDWRDSQREGSNGSIASRENVARHDGRAWGFREASDVVIQEFTSEASQVDSKLAEEQKRQAETRNLLDRLTELTGHVYVPIEATR